MVIHGDRTQDLHRYNTPTSSDVAALMIGDGHDTATAHLRNFRDKQGRIPCPVPRSRGTHHANPIRLPDRGDVGDETP